MSTDFMAFLSLPPHLSVSITSLTYPNHESCKVVQVVHGIEGLYTLIQVGKLGCVHHTVRRDLLPHHHTPQ